MEVAIGDLKWTLPLRVGGDTPLVGSHIGVIPTLVSCSTVSDWILCFNLSRVLKPRDLTASDNYAQGFPSISLRYHDNNERGILKWQLSHNPDKLLNVAISKEAATNIVTCMYRSLHAEILLSWSFRVMRYADRGLYDHPVRRIIVILSDLTYRICVGQFLKAIGSDSYEGPNTNPNA